MENVVINAKRFNGYFVKYPYGEHLNFIATSFIALKDGLNYHKWSMKPKIYIIETWSAKPKFRLLNAKQTKSIYEEILM